MSGRGRLTLGAYAATLMAAGALLPLVSPSTWILTAAILLAVQSGVGAWTRRVPLARPVTVAAQFVVTLLALTLVFAREQALLGFLPGPTAWSRFAALFQAGADDVGTYATPAPDTEGIRLMVISGVLLIGLLVDTLAVTFRSAAPAGLPLLALYSVAAGLSEGGASWLWFLFAASGYLLLLLAESRDRLSQWGRVFGGAPRTGRPGTGSGTGSGGSGGSGGGKALAAVRTGRRIGVVAMGVALAVPAVLPTLSGGLFGAPGGGPGDGGKGGTISAVNPLVSLQDNLRQPEDREVLRYRSNATDTNGQYLRLVALDQFDGTSWKSSVRPIEDVPERLPRPTGLSDLVRTIEVTGNFVASPTYEQKWLPMPFPADRVEIGGRWRYEPAGRMLVGDDGQNTAGARYSVTSLDVRPTAQQLADAPPAPESLRAEYTKIPDSLPPVVRATALQVTKNARNDYERAVKLQDWFTTDGGFRYDVDVDSGTGVQAITRFLERREGFCVHFSFSMAAMARSIGIPARVAVGFMPGSRQSDGTLSVGIRDAHAWPELYFEGAGWTRFEPTPSRGSAPEYTREQSPSGTPSESAQPSSSASAAPSAAPSTSESCPAQMRRQGECGQDEVAGAASSDGGGTNPLAVVLVCLGVAALVLLPLSPSLWRSRVRARRLGSSGRTAEDGAARTLDAWREINDTAWDHGVVPDESMTPRRTAARIVRLAALEGEPANAVHRVARAVEQVLYAPRPRPGTGLVDEVSLVRSGFTAASSRGVRIRALLAPHSAVRVVWAASAWWSTTTTRWRATRDALTTRATTRLRPKPSHPKP
ncbi:DUF3488 and DUF4129 domain-containing transglutaminase family protein [Streptomyces sp. NPDC090127]|uniref:transglutaminase TgpA family protein n=1 Tax=Streptomyces sp. NPDC090127 TaxID=3365953 RepID=UPI00381994BC